MRLGAVTCGRDVVLSQDNWLYSPDGFRCPPDRVTSDLSDSFVALLAGILGRSPRTYLLYLLFCVLIGVGKSHWQWYEGANT